MTDSIQITKELKLGFDPNRHLVTKLLEVMFDPAKKASVREWKDKFVKDDVYDHIDYLKSRTPRIPEINPQYVVSEVQANEENGNASDDKRKRKKNKYLPFKRKMLMIKDSMMANSNATIRYYAPMLRSIQRTNKVQNLAHWYTFPRPSNNPESADCEFQNMPSISKSPFAPWSIESEMIHVHDMFYLSQRSLTIDANSLCFNVYANEWTRVEISSNTIRNITFYPHPFYIKILFKAGCIQELVDASRSLPEVSEKHMRLSTKKSSRDMIMAFTKRAATLEDVEKIKKVIGKDKVMMSNNIIESHDQLRQAFNFAPRVVGYLKRDGRLEWPDLFKEKYWIYLEKDGNKGGICKNSMSTMQSAHVSSENSAHNATINLIIDKINKKNEKVSRSDALANELGYESPGKQKFKYKNDKSDGASSSNSQLSNLANMFKNSSGTTIQTAYLVTDGKTNESYVYAPIMGSNVNLNNGTNILGDRKIKTEQTPSNTVSNIAASWMAANNENNLQNALTESTPKNASKLIQNRSVVTPDVSPIGYGPGRKPKQIIKPNITDTCIQTDPISDEEDDIRTSVENEILDNISESESTRVIQKRKLNGTESDTKKLKLSEDDSQTNSEKGLSNSDSKGKAVDLVKNKGMNSGLSNADLQKLLKTVNAKGGGVLQVVSINNASGMKQQGINPSSKYVVLNNNQDTNNILQKLNSGGLKFMANPNLKPGMLPKLNKAKFKDDQKKHKLNSIMKNIYQKQLNKGSNNEGAQSHDDKDESKELMFCPGRSLSNVFSIFNYTPSPTHHVKLHGSDLLCLNYGQYINDNIINFYLYYIYYEVMSEEQRQRTHLFNVFFNTKLQGSSALTCTDPPVARHSRVSTWTKKVDIFDKDYIIIPINEAQHWFLGIVCFPWMVGMVSYDNLLGRGRDDNTEAPVIPENDTKFATETRFERVGRLKDRYDIEPLPCILLFDSLQGQPRAANVRVIREYLKSEWEAKRSHTDGPLVFDKNTIRGYNPKVPQQDNKVDCGIYLVHYVEMFFKDPLKNFTKDFFENQLLGWFDGEMINGKREFIQNLVLRKADEKRERIVQGGYLAEPGDAGSQEDEYPDEDRLEEVDGSTD